MKNNNFKKKAMILVLSLFIFGMFLFIFISAAPISEDLHLNIQTTDATGSVITGTFEFVFNISASSNCSDTAKVIYNNSTTLTTDSRGIISYYLPNVSLNYSNQYWLCYYRNGSLINSSKIARTPYTFRARNISLSGVEVDSNFNLTDYNVTNVNYGFFNYLGSLVNRVINLFVIDINASGNVDVGGNLTANNADFNGGWQNNGLSIIDGDIYAQTGYFYNITSLNVTEQDLTIIDDLIVQGNTFLNKNLTVDTNTLFVDSGLNRVGIGTNNPGAKLEINTDSDIGLQIKATGGSPQLLKIEDTGSNSILQIYNNRNVFFPSSHVEMTASGTSMSALDLKAANSGQTKNIFRVFNKNNVESVVVDPDGRVGIGTASPSALLHVEDGNVLFNGTNSPQGFFFNESSGNIGIGTTNPGESLEVVGNIEASLGLNIGSQITRIGDVNTFIRFSEDQIQIAVGNEYLVDIRETTQDYVKLGDGGDIDINLNDDMFIEGSSGKVGIGTATPQNKLNVVGEGNFTGTVYAHNFSGNSNITFINGSGSEIVRFTDDGRVGIGTTSPSEKLEVVGGGNTAIVINADTSPRVNFKVNYVTEGYVWANTDAIAIGQGGTTTSLFVTSVGNVGIGTSSVQNKLDVEGGAVIGATYSGTNTAPSNGLLVQGNVGIGTASPDDKLDIEAAHSQLRLTDSDDNNFTQLSYSSEMLAFRNNNVSMTPILVIHDDGNVGIGTTSPEIELHIVTDQNWTYKLGGHSLSLKAGNYSSSRYPYIEWRDNTSTRGMYLGWGVPGEYMQLQLEDGNDFAISGGNVGIGITTPNRPLHINKNDALASLIQFTNTATGTTSSDGTDIGFDNNEWSRIWNYENTGIYFGTNNIERMRISNIGNVGIGTTSPGGKLHITTNYSNTQQIIDTYSTVSHVSSIALRKSNNNTLGSESSTDSGDLLGEIQFKGVDNGDVFDSGAIITAIQDGAAGATVPTNLLFETYSSTAKNTNQFVLHNDGNVGIGTTSPLTIHTDAPEFNDSTPKMEILTGTAGNVAYSELVTIRHSGIDVVARTREVGLLFKLSGESSTGESQKMGGMILESTLAYANTPNLHLLTKNQRRLTILDGGNVGIGTTSPQNKLNVIGDINFTGLIYGNGSQLTGTGVPAGTISAFYSNTCPTGWILADGTSGTPDLRGIFVRGAGTSGVLKYANAALGYLDATYGEYLNDSFQGHYHGSTSSNFYTSDLSGTSYDISGAGAEESFYLLSNAIGAPKSDGTHGTPRIGAETRPASYALTYCMKTSEDSETSNTIWGSSGDNVFVQNTSKKVGIGTTSPEAKLHVDGDGTEDILNISDDGSQLLLVSGNPNVVTIGTSPSYSLLNVGGTVHTSTSAGSFSNDLCTSSSGYGYYGACSASSIRYKENIEDLNLGLNEVMKLKPIKFTYKESYLNDTLPMNKLQAGLIAEEVEEISSIFVKHNEEGNPEDVRYKQLTALLINAIQEQQAQIQALQVELCQKDNTYSWCK